MSAERQTSRKILVVDDDQDFCWAMGNVLQAAGYSVIQAQDGREAMSLLEKDTPDLILLDYRMPGETGLKVAAKIIKKRGSEIPIIMITAYSEVKSAVEAIKMGVYDYVAKPIDNNDLVFTIKRALEKQYLVQEVEHLRKALTERASLYELMGKSDQIKKLVQLLEKAAPTPFTVLIQGESGTGKELVARAIHDFSLAKEGPFVAVDCGAIPETLIESELFGYMKGAFTGAHTDKPGQFELADGGTLFLDEVGNLPYLAQQKLLRAMQERCIQRLGAKKAQPIQVRIIAAT
ncbi:MAG: sigma-54 dependent transcriptional regulator, partial [Pseudomonadota bacterium]